MREAMLSTFDNPYSPFKDFDKWYAFDVQRGYNTLSYLDRLCPRSSEDFGNFEDEMYDAAMNTIIRFEPQTYHKVYEDA